MISLTVTPAMCAYVLSRENAGHSKARWAMWVEKQFDRFKNAYSRSLTAVLDHSLLVDPAADRPAGGQRVPAQLLPATFFPEQDTGILIGQIIADQSISFPAMEKKLAQLQEIVQKDPAVQSVAGFTGGRALNTANVFVELKPLAQRHATATEVVNRLRPKLNAVSGRAALHAGAAGSADRRTAVGRRVPVHADERRFRRAVRLDAQAGRPRSARSAARCST